MVAGGYRQVGARALVVAGAPGSVVCVMGAGGVRGVARWSVVQLVGDMVAPVLFGVGSVVRKGLRGHDWRTSRVSPSSVRQQLLSFVTWGLPGCRAGQRSLGRGLLACLVVTWCWAAGAALRGSGWVSGQ